VGLRAFKAVLKGGNPACLFQNDGYLIAKVRRTSSSRDDQATMKRSMRELNDSRMQKLRRWPQDRYTLLSHKKNKNQVIVQT
jgi:hypothetical protein